MINQYMIPKRLSDCLFLKTRRKGAAEPAWPVELDRFEEMPDGTYREKATKKIYRTVNNKTPYNGPLTTYPYDVIMTSFNDMLTVSKNEATYGVLTGYKGLVVVDVDDKDTACELYKIPEFASTFTVTSPKGLPHFYFKCEPYSPTTAFDKGTGTNKKRIIDIKGKSGYVIGPGSRFMSHNEYKEYTVENDIDIVDIDYDRIIKLIEERIDEKAVKKLYNEDLENYYVTDPISEEIFKNVTCTEILEENGIDVSNNPGDTPFAVSENKTCLHRSGYLYYDFHSLRGGTVIDLYAWFNKLSHHEAMFELAERIGVTNDIIKQATTYFMKNKAADLVMFIATRFTNIYPVKAMEQENRSVDIYRYVDGVYFKNTQPKIRNFTRNMTGKWYTKAFGNKIIDIIAAEMDIDTDEFFDDQHKHLVPVQNGLLNIYTRELEPFSPDKIFFNKLPVIYDPDAKCPETLKHFEKVLNGEKDVKTMQELYGSLLYREYKWEKAFIFYGNGSNGKSVTTKQMNAFLGLENFTTMTLEKMQNNNFMLGQLQNKMANIAPEIGNARLDDTDVFKSLTGGDYISADVKFKDPVKFLNFAKMVFCANNVPESADDSDGFWRRWVMLGFTKKFLNQSEYNTLKKEEKLESHHRLKDYEIDNKLQNPEELSGVLNWALDGLKRLMERNEFSDTDSINEVRNMWRKQANSGMGFRIDCLQDSHRNEDFVWEDDMLAAYSQYCKSNGIHMLDVRKFRKTLTSENINIMRTKRKGEYIYKYRNTKIKDWDHKNQKFIGNNDG